MFTYEIYLLCVLTEEAWVASVTFAALGVVRRSEDLDAGDPELPFERKRVGNWINALTA
jgi:hypothetical protein